MKVCSWYNLWFCYPFIFYIFHSEANFCHSYFFLPEAAVVKFSLLKRPHFTLPQSPVLQLTVLKQMYKTQAVILKSVHVSKYSQRPSLFRVHLLSMRKLTSRRPQNFFCASTFKFLLLFCLSAINASLQPKDAQDTASFYVQKMVTTFTHIFFALFQDI